MPPRLLPGAAALCLLLRTVAIADGPPRNDLHGEPVAAPISDIFERSYPADIVRPEPADAEIHEVLADPRKFAGKKIRIVGTIDSGFEYAQMIDSRGKGLRIWPRTFWVRDFIKAEGLEKEFGGAKQQKEFIGYLDWGGHFGHMGAWPYEFTIVETYPAGADKARRAEIKGRYLKFLEALGTKIAIPDLPPTPESRRAWRALQGSWTVTAVQNQGQVPHGGVGTRWTINGDRLKTGSPGQWSWGTLRIDPNRTPAAIDFSMAEAHVSTGFICGLFSVEGDNLTVCWCPNPSRRPKAFAADHNSWATLFTLKRDPVNLAAQAIASKEPAEPDDPQAIAELQKNNARLEHDEHGNVVTVILGHIPGTPRRVPTDAQLARLRKLHHIEAVEVLENDVTDAGLECLANCPRLARLQLIGKGITDAGLEHKGITDAGLEHIGKLARLEYLSLSHTSVTDAGLEQLKELKALKSLRIWNSDLAGPGLAFLGRLAELEELDLFGSDVTDDVFKYAAQLPLLKVMRLNWTKVGDSQAAYLESCTKLEHLDLSATRFGDAGTAHLRNLHRLTRLCLGGTKVTDAGMSNLRELGTLETLQLYSTRVGNVGVSQLTGLKNLRSLSLGTTRVTDVGLTYLRDLPNLESLGLDDSPITNVGVKRLQSFPSLEELLLARTRVDDDGLEYLKSFPKLHRVTLSRPRVTREAAQSLADALPKLSVYYDNQWVGPKHR
ncbi:MAG: TIGR03067 domain-containing protein [Thermoguttaceae bacterium]|jgi:uncharacterized protein (TIGR03067 family)